MSQEKGMTSPGWPEWLTPEWSALHTRVENALKAGEQHVYDSADAAGMDWTSGGMLSCRASAVLNMLKRDGWIPPETALLPEEAAPDPVYPGGDEAGPDEECDICGEVDWLTPVEAIDRSTLMMCDHCAIARDQGLLALARGVPTKERNRIWGEWNGQ